MRIEGLPTPYIPDRTARQSSAVSPYRESQRAVESELERQQAQSTQSNAERATPPRPVVQAEAPADLGDSYYPARFALQADERPLTSRAAQALASYTTTAGLVRDLDANEVLGLDLYA